MNQLIWRVWRSARRTPWILIAGLLVSGCAATGPGANDASIWTRLPITVQIVSLPGSSRETSVVACFAEIRYRNIQFIKRDDGYHAELEFTFSLSDTVNGNPVRLIDRLYELHVQQFRETVDRQKIHRIVERIEVPVGSYIVEVVVRDRNAKSQGIIREQLKLPDFYSHLSISKPILMWDSVTTLDPEKMIPFRNRNFDRDFFALVIVGGLQPGVPVSIQYALFDNRNQDVFERSLKLVPDRSVKYVALRIPVNKLVLGSTRLQIVARHGRHEASSQRIIYSTFGQTSQFTENIASYIEPMRYIMNSREWRELYDAPPEKQNELFKQFWKERDPTPEDEDNPLLEEFFLRVEEANQRFSWGSEEGWKTDRGRIFIIYGPPDSIERQKSPRTGITYEIWRYYNLGRQFVFEDRYNNGNYRLFSSSY